MGSEMKRGNEDTQIKNEKQPLPSLQCGKITVTQRLSFINMISAKKTKCIRNICVLRDQHNSFDPDETSVCVYVRKGFL